MKHWLHEYWIAAALFAVAAVVPLVWASVDSQRRLELQQTAHIACVLHRKLEHCAHLRPEVLHPQAFEYCRLRYSNNECVDFRVRSEP